MGISISRFIPFGYIPFIHLCFLVLLFFTFIFYLCTFNLFPLVVECNKCAQAKCFHVVMKENIYAEVE